MNARVAFLFTIAKEIQHSFTSPVIFFTRKDYADGIFKAFKNIRQALLEQSPPEKIAEIVYSFHMKWLEAVQEIEKFKKRVKETPRDVILKAIDYTIECTHHRYNRIRKYIDKIQFNMTEEENQLMQTDLTIIKDMQEIVNSALLEKQQYILTQADQTEYHVRIHDEIEELLYWLDRLNDNLAIEFCKVLNFKVPLAPSSLTKTLKDIIEEVASDPCPEAQRIAELIHVKSRALSFSVRLSSVNELEIAKVIEKIRALEERINRLQAHNSSALLALKHKTVFLEERLQSLENIKMSLKKLRKDSGSQNAAEMLNENRDMHIFNHLLPHHDRCRLVEKLIELWNSAMVDHHDHESIISILSVANLKEIFSDEKGNFTVDQYGRKIYTFGNDNILYQLNEHNKLVPLRDDDKHVYFYDSCGRYYINKTRERVYKDHDGASEYMLDKSGYLVKVLEEKEGIRYYYDWLGRYYLNSEGRHIYCEEDSKDKYEHDGLGNLVKIHSQTFYYAPCSTEPMTTEENKYLKREVGDALKKCIAEVVAHQPADPIAYLADRLTKYSDNIIAHQKHLTNEQERFEQSQLIQATEENSVYCSYADCETVDDYNFINYEHEIDESLTSF